MALVNGRDSINKLAKQMGKKFVPIGDLKLMTFRDAKKLMAISAILGIVVGLSIGAWIWN